MRWHVVAALLAAALAAPVAHAKLCVFLHGAGERVQADATSTDTASYWGGDKIISKYSPAACTEWVFNHDDTVTQRFDDPNLKKRYCDVATGGTGQVTDAIVFTHSMGNNIFAAALRDGDCSIDHTSSTWYAASSPGGGSKAADFVDKLCANNSTDSKALQEIAKLMHYCADTDPPTPNLAYDSLRTTYPGLQGLKEVIAREAAGAMCGDSDFGLTSVYSLLFEALADFVKYGEDNDGMVGIDSCLLDGVTYGSDPSNDFYRAAINHADGTCRNGNGDFGNSRRQPCAWFKART
eukprot:CAMPEP_0203815040 /NCGR_PEP_ID=MMETSP0115-20131106/7448_1 /ASSEMBLY_ACC=CAM_ASM_000227 /TAXON_ID=33651 /ORGANISM="Bicosoecid sp, Strain ms1" /LENGTH=293 /DNA_ID=CAMNT_0050723929 /DNA_START=165 /DNA_END=1046 /DNA_ORIENTATION=-